jgi:hypothetical protein
MPWDFIHRGLVDLSDRWRPVTFTVFCRDWRVGTSQGAHRYEKRPVPPSASKGFDRGFGRLTRRARIMN